MPDSVILRRRRRPAALFAAAAAVLSASALAFAPHGSGAVPEPCRESACFVVFKVGKKPVRWLSPEVFYPNNEQLYARPSVGLRSLMLLRSFGARRCRHRFAGAGLTVVIKACGDKPPLRLRAKQTKRAKRGGARTLTLDYVAFPMLDGPPPRPSGAYAPIRCGLCG